MLNPRRGNQVYVVDDQKEHTDVAKSRNIEERFT
jgi:hypothetical protein